jgi:cellulose synthase/poly-beta-1,6-N-acetylglucosamine synthase-like glycosyltransferase
MLDIGTKPDNYAVAQLYKYMLKNEDCGGCCGEIEVDLTDYKCLSKYLIRSA